jgi:hypothetical protein
MTQLFDNADEWMRSQRNIKLKESDFTQLPDVYSNEIKQKWATYRQALRDLPANCNPSLDNNGNLTGVEWPTKPE